MSREHRPAWLTDPLWVIYRETTTHPELRQYCLQPEEQSPEVHLLYRSAAAVHEELLATLRADVAEARRRRRK